MVIEKGPRPGLIGTQRDPIGTWRDPERTIRGGSLGNRLPLDNAFQEGRLQCTCVDPGN